MKNWISRTHLSAKTSTQLNTYSLSGLLRWKIYLEGEYTLQSLVRCILPLNLLFFGSKYSKVPLEYSINYHVLYINTYFIFFTKPLKIIVFLRGSCEFIFKSSSEEESSEIFSITIGLYYYNRESKSIFSKNLCFLRSFIVLSVSPFPSLSLGIGLNSYDIKSLAFSSIPSSILYLPFLIS